LSLKNIEKHLFYWGVSFKNAEKALVLLCFRSHMLKNHWF